MFCLYTECFVYRMFCANYYCLQGNGQYEENVKRVRISIHIALTDINTLENHCTSHTLYTRRLAFSLLEYVRMSSLMSNKLTESINDGS